MLYFSHTFVVFSGFPLLPGRPVRDSGQKQDSGC